jgi:hypothetical protein
MMTMQVKTIYPRIPMKQRYRQDTWKQYKKNKRRKHVANSLQVITGTLRNQNQCLEGEDDRDDELEEFEDVLPLRSEIFSGVGERDGSSNDDEAEGAAVGLAAASVVAFWRRDWFHDV